MNIAVIPARGGSKRIPRKNIKVFFGKPIIQYAIDAAVSSGLFAKVIVSTDDDEIALISSSLGALVPFRRPKDLADDFTPTVPVIAHAIKECENRNWIPESVCCLYPCIPFVEINDLKKAFEKLNSSQEKYIFPVVKFPSVIERALRFNDQGNLYPVFPGMEKKRTQDLGPAYYDAGQFYLAKKKTWTENGQIHSNGIGIPIPIKRAIDIDTPEDWDFAESMKFAYERI